MRSTDSSDRTPDGLSGHVFLGARALAREFRRARPFPHVVIDDFLDRELYDRLRGAFPRYERRDRGHPNPLGGGARHEDVHSLGEPFRELDELLGSQAFLRWLEVVFGREGLLHDPDYVGGGAQQVPTGEECDVHVEFSHHPTRSWRRALQLTIYFNDVWDETWGGHHDLHLDPWDRERDEVKSILPLGNRAVLTVAGSDAWSGFRRLSIPAGESTSTRRSFRASYYLAVESRRPAEPRHGVVHVEREVPERLREGVTLDIDAQLEVVRLVQRRLDHAQRLFDREMGMIRELRRLLQQDFPPGHPATREWIESVRWLTEEQDRLLRFLYERERSLAARLETVARMEKPKGLHGLPLFGPVVIMAWEGFWPGDCWAGEHLKARIHFAEPVSRCTLVGNLPDQAPGECDLSLRFGEFEEERVFERGIFCWEIPVAGVEDTQLDLEITCRSTYSPRALGHHPEDDRQLAFQIRSLYFS